MGRAEGQIGNLEGHAEGAAPRHTDGKSTGGKSGDMEDGAGSSPNASNENSRALRSSRKKAST